jgi:protein-S-isoprenylcysteine O-methyltransferase Ste14
MINGFFLSLVMLAILLIFFAVDFWFMHRFDRERDSGKGWSWDYTLLLIVMSLVVILQPWLIPWLGWTTLLLWGLAVQIVGSMLVLLSFGLHIWSRHHLRRFYTERVEVQRGHQVVNSGPYAVVRHPIFTSFFLLVIGLFLINPALTTLTVMLYTFWDFSRAAQQEEETLGKNLPDYAAYMAGTSRFLPRLRKP